MLPKSRKEPSLEIQGKNEMTREENHECQKGESNGFMPSCLSFLVREI